MPGIKPDITIVERPGQTMTDFAIIPALDLKDDLVVHAPRSIR